MVDTLPTGQETALGRAVSAGDEEKVHVVALDAAPESVTAPPEDPRASGVAVNEITVGAGGPASVRVTAVAITVLVASFAAREKLYVLGAALVFAGIVTVLKAEPEPQPTVAGNPARPGDEEKVQLVTAVSVAESTTGPPAAPRLVGLAPKESTAGPRGAGWLTTRGGAFSFFVPMAVSENVKDRATVPGLPGTVSVCEKVPEAHDTVVGKPLSAGFTEMVQVLAPPTVAERCSVPPLEWTRDGVAVNPDTEGPGTPATTTLALAFTGFDPVAPSVKV